MFRFDVGHFSLLCPMRSITMAFLCGAKQDDKTIRWCPAPNCTFAVKKLTAVALLAYECECGESYCFECGDPVHEVVTCMQLETFKNHTDGESYMWIANNTKNCPGCKAPIEKNEGCNHMVT